MSFQNKPSASTNATPNNGTTFAEFLLSQQNESEFTYFTDALSDNGITFPSDAEGFVDSLAAGDCDDLLSHVEALANELIYTGKTLVNMCNEFEAQRKIEKQVGEKMQSVNVEDRHGVEIFGNFHVKDGMVHVRYNNIFRSTQIGGLQPIVVAEMLLREMSAKKKKSS